MKTNIHISLSILFIILIFSCNKKDSKPSITKVENFNVDSLINLNLESQLFLDYYKGLDNEIYDSISTRLLENKKIIKTNDSLFYVFKIGNKQYKAYQDPKFEKNKLKSMRLNIQDLCFCFIKSKPKKSIIFSDLKPIKDSDIINDFIKLYKSKYGKPIITNMDAYDITNPTDFVYYRWDDKNGKSIRFKIGKQPVAEGISSWTKELGKSKKFNGKKIGEKIISFNIDYSLVEDLNYLEKTEKLQLDKIKQYELKKIKELKNNTLKTINDI